VSLCILTVLQGIALVPDSSYILRLRHDEVSVSRFDISAGKQRKIAQLRIEISALIPASLQINTLSFKNANFLRRGPCVVSKNMKMATELLV
jgi:hypothetical protein